MKKWVIFVLGIIAGFILTIIVLFVIAANRTDPNLGLTLFDEPGECVSENSFEIFQVLDSGDALAIERKKNRYGGIESGVTVLFLNEGDGAYYDNQIIEAPTGYCVKQVGIYKYIPQKYKYIPQKDVEKTTVPVVCVLKK